MDNQETNAVWICESCVHGPPSSFGGNPCAVCNPHDPLLNYYQKREETITTNADRIRAMSDEEMAEWLAREISGHCRACSDYEKCLTYGWATDAKAWLDWLKQEARDD